MWKIGIDSYSLYPKRLHPFDLLEWAASNGAEGVQFTDVHLPEFRQPDAAFLTALQQAASERNLYLEWGGGQHIPFDMRTWEARDWSLINQTAADQAHKLGVRVIRSCSGGLMRWGDDAPSTETLLRHIARFLREQRAMLLDRGVVLAIETHFEFTSFELLRLFDMCDAQPGEWLGICLDTANLLIMLEDPLAATERLWPWVESLHCKDAVITPDKEGFCVFPVPIGTGIVDFDGILRRLALLPREVRLSIEQHGGSFAIPAFDGNFLSRFPDLNVQEFARIMQLAERGRDLVQTGGAAITERQNWDAICKDATIANINSLKNIRDGIVTNN